MEPEDSEIDLEVQETLAQLQEETHDVATQFMTILNGLCELRDLKVGFEKSPTHGVQRRGIGLLTC